MRFRVNYGQGQVSDSTDDLAKAIRILHQNSDVAGALIEHRVAVQDGETWAFEWWPYKLKSPVSSNGRE